MKRKVLAAQNISRMCLVCGTDNGSGLHGRFYELDGGELLGVFAPRDEHQGYPGRLHGGMASTMLDETIGRAAAITDPGAWGVTVELTVRFRKPVPLDGDVRVLGRVTKDSSRLFEGTGEIVLPDGTVAVEASGKYLKMPIDRIVTGDGFDEQWFADERPLPPSVEI
jgi:acyl-coenzyme A thioesterase PaaI-like protein